MGRIFFGLSCPDSGEGAGTISSGTSFFSNYLLLNAHASHLPVHSSSCLLILTRSGECKNFISANNPKWFHGILVINISVFNIHIGYKIHSVVIFLF